MLRTALRPRWLALLVVVLVAATGMSMLGQWQLNRARERSQEPADQAQQIRQQAAPRPVAEVVAPRQTFPREAIDTRVSVSGTWAPDDQVLVADRELEGRSGFWVLLPVLLPDGSAVPVVRGWVASATDPAVAAAPRGDVEVIGWLQPSEPPMQRAPGETSTLPAGQIERVAVAELVSRWSPPLITGFVVRETESPAIEPMPTAVPPPENQPGLDLQNLSYAVQWWLFAGFGLFLWWRLVRDDHRGLLRPGPESVVPDDLSSLSDVPDRQPDVSDRKIGPKNL